MFRGERDPTTKDSPLWAGQSNAQRSVSKCQGMYLDGGDEQLLEIDLLKHPLPTNSFLPLT